MPVEGGFQQPQTEEAVISKLDSMDKEIVECEEDIKNLGQLEVCACSFMPMLASVYSI